MKETTNVSNQPEGLRGGLEGVGDARAVPAREKEPISASGGVSRQQLRQILEEIPSALGMTPDPWPNTDEQYDKLIEEFGALVRDPPAPAICKECGCTTGGASYCYKHAPYTITPLKDGSYYEDRNGARLHVLAVRDPPAWHPMEHLAFIAVMNALDVHMPPDGVKLLHELRQIAGTVGYPWAPAPPGQAPPQTETP